MNPICVRQPGSTTSAEPGRRRQMRWGFAIQRLAAMESRMFARRTIIISGPASA
jgi:hypothetical protein